jgi:hypothetical protein
MKNETKQNGTKRIETNRNDPKQNLKNGNNSETKRKKKIKGQVTKQNETKQNETKRIETNRNDPKQNLKNGNNSETKRKKKSRAK